MSATARLELFECTRLHVRLTRTACAGRWSKENRGKAARTYGYTGEPDSTPRESSCVGCPVGGAHAAGERPDVPLASVEVAASAPRDRSEVAVPAVPARNDDVARPSAGKEPTMGQMVECKYCGETFERKHGPQKTCDACRPARKRKPKGTKADARSTAPAERTRVPRTTSEGPVAAAHRIVDLLQSMDADDRRKTVQIVEIALGDGDAA